MADKILIADRDERLLIDWTITIHDDVLSGTWAFDRCWWIGWRPNKRTRKLMKAARQEIRRFMADNWERFTAGDDERLFVAARLRLVPRRMMIDWKLAPAYWPWSVCDW